MLSRSPSEGRPGGRMATHGRAPRRGRGLLRADSEPEPRVNPPGSTEEAPLAEVKAGVMPVGGGIRGEVYVNI